MIDGVEQPRSAPYRFAAGAPALPYHSIALQTPAGYTPNDASVGDLDGDGQYEIVLHQTGVAKDNSQPGVTDAPIFQAYKLDGTLLWTINLGRNVREGAHYTQFLVYDFDGDGRAEFVCKTADGTTDGTGKVFGDANANWLTPESAGETPGSVTAPRREGTSGSGFILSGPEYLTVFDGLTGKALASETYLPRRHPNTDSPTPEQMKETWGDGHGNRIDRFLAGVAYLDGERPEHRDGARLLHARRARGLGLLATMAAETQEPLGVRQRFVGEEQGVSRPGQSQSVGRRRRWRWPRRDHLRRRGHRR